MASSLKTIYKAWQAVDDLLETAAAQETESASIADESRGTTDCAYFVLLFAQLEIAINECYMALDKANFDRCPSCGRSNPFMNRFQTIADIYSISEDIIDQIYDDYELRCKIAHGEIVKAAIYIPEIANEYEIIIAKIKAV
jgi:hypothetical protein